MVHVHVYKVIRKAEIDIDETDLKVAMEEALRRAKNSELIFAQSDCEFLAEAFDDEGQGHRG